MSDLEWFEAALRGVGVAGRGPEVAQRAAEVLRTLEVKCPRGQLFKNEHCRRAVCLYLACEEVGATVRKDAILAASNAKAKDFDAAYKIAIARLGNSALAPRIELDYAFLASRMMPSVSISARRAVVSSARTAAKRFCARLEQQGRAHPRGENDAALVAAAFFIAARRSDAPVDQREMQSMVHSTKAEFNSVCESVDDDAYWTADQRPPPRTVTFLAPENGRAQPTDAPRDRAGHAAPAAAGAAPPAAKGRHKTGVSRGRAFTQIAGAQQAHDADMARRHALEDAAEAAALDAETTVPARRALTYMDWPRRNVPVPKIPTMKELRYSHDCVAYARRKNLKPRLLLMPAPAPQSDADEAAPDAAGAAPDASEASPDASEAAPDATPDAAGAAPEALDATPDVAAATRDAAGAAPEASEAAPDAADARPEAPDARPGTAEAAPAPQSLSPPRLKRPLEGSGHVSFATSPLVLASQQQALVLALQQQSRREDDAPRGPDAEACDAAPAPQTSPSRRRGAADEPMTASPPKGQDDQGAQGAAPSKPSSPSPPTNRADEGPSPREDEDAREDEARQPRSPDAEAGDLASAPSSLSRPREAADGSKDGSQTTPFFDTRWSPAEEDAAGDAAPKAGGATPEASDAAPAREGAPPAPSNPGPRHGAAHGSVAASPPGSRPSCCFFSSQRWNLTDGPDDRQTSRGAPALEQGARPPTPKAAGGASPPPPSSPPPTTGDEAGGAAPSAPANPRRRKAPTPREAKAPSPREAPTTPFLEAASSPTPDEAGDAASPRPRAATSPFKASSPPSPTKVRPSPPPRRPSPPEEAATPPRGPGAPTSALLAACSSPSTQGVAPAPSFPETASSPRGTAPAADNPEQRGASPRSGAQPLPRLSAPEQRIPEERPPKPLEERPSKERLSKERPSVERPPEEVDRVTPPPSQPRVSVAAADAPSITAEDDATPPPPIKAKDDATPPPPMKAEDDAMPPSPNKAKDESTPQPPLRKRPHLEGDDASDVAERPPRPVDSEGRRADSHDAASPRDVSTPRSSRKRPRGGSDGSGKRPRGGSDVSLSSAQKIRRSSAGSSASESVSSRRSGRVSSSTAPPRVSYCGMQANSGWKAAWENAFSQRLHALGWVSARDDLQEAKKVTHLVVGDLVVDLIKANLVIAVNCGCLLVTSDWLLESAKTQRCAPAAAFVKRDAAFEQVLRLYDVVIHDETQTRSTANIAEVVRTAGGNFVSKWIDPPKSVRKASLSPVPSPAASRNTTPTPKSCASPQTPRSKERPLIVIMPHVKELKPDQFQLFRRQLRSLQNARGAPVHAMDQQALYVALLRKKIDFEDRDYGAMLKRS